MIADPKTSPHKNRIAQYCAGDPGALLVREKNLPALLGVSRATVRRAMAAGRFPKCIRIGGCVAWRRADLEQWIAGGCGVVEADPCRN